MAFGAERPDKPPGWMKTTLDVFQVVSPVLGLAVLWWFLVQPWLRHHRVTLDGLLCLALFTTSIYDPLVDLLSPWYTYNTVLVNRGSILGLLPGHSTYYHPGAVPALPLLFIPPVYIWAFMLLVVGGDSLLTKIKTRWPILPVAGQIATIWVLMAIGDFLMEGLFMQRVAFHTYNGGSFNLFSIHYYRYPATLFLILASMLTTLVAFRHYRNARGEAWVDRGTASARDWQTTVTRFLAILAFVQVSIVGISQAPAVLIGTLHNPWPADIQNRSYLTDQLCGPTVGQPCPGSR